MLSLRELQERFFHAIARIPTAGSKGWCGVDYTLVRLVHGDRQLGSEARLDIYAQMYYARLLDVLCEDFPRTAAVLGGDQFRDIGRAYLQSYPSTRPSLRHLGEHFASFLATRAEAATQPFLVDLARLEWVRLDVFDAADVAPLQVEHLQAIPAEEWPALRFRLIPAMQALRCDWPVHRIWAEEEPLPGEHHQPAEIVLRVWREEFSVYQACMDATEQTALVQVRAGAPFGAVCSALEPLLPAGEVAPTMGSLLLRWIQDGILQQLV